MTGSQASRAAGAARRLVALAVVAALLLGSGRAGAAEPSEDAKGLIKDNYEVVVGFAYPFAKSADGVQFRDKTNLLNGGFTLTYRFSYTGVGGGKGSFDQKFTFDKNGKMTGITNVDWTDFFFAPGTSAKVMLAALKEVVKNDPELKKDPNWSLLLKVDDPTTGLIAILNIKNGKTGDK